MKMRVYEKYAMANLAASGKNGGAKKKEKKYVKTRDETKKKDMVEKVEKVRRHVFSRFVLCHRVICSSYILQKFKDMQLRLVL